MYKKIKNGSFMNWIWFIITLAPILLITIYSLNYFFNKEIYYNENTTIDTNLVNENNITYAKLQYNTNNGLITWVQNTRTNLEIQKEDYTLNQNYTLYITTLNNNEIYVNYYNGTTDQIITFNENNYYFDFNAESINNTVFSIFIDEEEGMDNNIPNGTIIYLFLTTKKDNYYTKEFIIDYGNQNGLLEIKEFEASSDLSNYLNKILYSIQTNGFISSAFLNLAQFFGVNNIYYSLACYYIEYLLVIILLHLAFDILYIVPNICHKFMEKIGGERD